MHTDSSLDVRQVVPRKRHPLVFSTFEALEPGEGFILIADHDPRPLCRQFEARRASQFSWDYLEQGPVVWRVRIGRQPQIAESLMQTCNTRESTTDGAVGLVAEWQADLHASYADEPTVTDVRIGVFYSAVEISTGDVGVAFSPRDLSDTVCCPKTVAGAPPAGRLIGLGAWEMTSYALAASPLRRAVGIATLNALSAAAINRYGLPEGLFQEGLDALAAAEFRPSDEVVMVGAFIPFIKALRERVAKLRIVDKHAEALKPDELSMWVPPESATDALARASVAIMSGSALVEGGIEELLDAAAPARSRIMAGPTTPIWPAPFFKRGVDVLGGIRVKHGKQLLEIVGQGGSGYFFEQAAEKYCVARPSIGFRTKGTVI
jgi:uncharacterized protein (DUF2249 family)/uncharacterized protein (DUF4213/DUF364 family)